MNSVSPGAPERLRVAVVAESFLPLVNGVVNSVLRILEHLRREGHEAVVIAPALPRSARVRGSGAAGISRFSGAGRRAGAGSSAQSMGHGALRATSTLGDPGDLNAPIDLGELSAPIDLGELSASGKPSESSSPSKPSELSAPTEVLGFPVIHVPSVQLPRIDSLPVGVPMPRVLRALRDFRPDVVHLASPFVLGAGAAAAARVLRIPTVAVYQTDIPGFVDQYDLGILIPPAQIGAWGVVRMIHNRAAVTLAPSTATIRELEERGVQRVSYWPRGVDADLFSPRRRREDLRREWDATGTRHLVGYVGRLASEKNVQRLRALTQRGDIQLVVVGDGPERPRLQRLLPGAVFTGELHGTALAEAYASLDVFVHTGEFETFCQGLQEALASGVPAVAPAAGGPLDLITPGVNGELLEVEHFERDLPDAVDRLLGPDHGRLAAMARAGVVHRTWPALCEELIDVYRAVVSG